MKKKYKYIIYLFQNLKIKYFNKKKNNMQYSFSTNIIFKFNLK